MVVPIIGSMAVKGVFQAGSLLSGLGSTSGKLKEVQQRSKSTSTEMKRMTGQANMLKGALAAIGVAGFSALLMTTPQLAGALAKIKYEMQMIAWSIGKHLKPVLDSVSTILRGIRTGDWSVVIQGVKDLAEAVGTILIGAWEKVKTVVYDALMSNKYIADFITWIESLKTAWNEGDLGGLIKTALIEPFQWLWDNGKTLFDDIVRWAKWAAGEIAGSIGPAIRQLPVIGPMIGVAEAGIGFAERMHERGGRQVGGMIGQTGMYKMHAGETVTMAGSTPSGGVGGTTDITVDFSGANINLASGIQLDQFADAISKKIAERQQLLTY